LYSVFIHYLGTMEKSSMPTQKFQPMSEKRIMWLTSAWTLRIGFAVLVSIILLLVAFGTAAR
jgi:hypothetical protein